MNSTCEEPNNDCVPSYEESLQQGAGAGPSTETKGRPQNGPPMSLNQQLSSVRLQRINAIISEHIDPLLLEQAQTGLFKTTFVFVPSNSSSLQRPNQASTSFSDIIQGSGDAINNDNGEKVVGFPSEDYVRMVRLHGHEYTLEFWRQPAVIQELNGALKANLHASGHRIASANSMDPQSSSSSVSAESLKGRKGFFSRKRNSAATATPSASIPESGGGWRFEKEEVLAPGHVRVKVGLQDVCLRVVTDMGLFETRTGKAVVVNIEIGS